MTLIDLDALLSPLEKELFARAVEARPTADVVREAIQAHAAEIRPVIVWAAAAHGYVHVIPSMQLAIRVDDVERLQAFVVARGGPRCELPFAVGVTPWRIEFLSGFGCLATSSIPTTEVFTGRVRVGVMTLDALLGQPQALETFERDLQRLRAGTYTNDDGERGLVAWDFTGRLCGGAAKLDGRTTKPFNFVDFR